MRACLYDYTFVHAHTAGNIECIPVARRSRLCVRGGRVSDGSSGNEHGIMLDYVCVEGISGRHATGRRWTWCPHTGGEELAQVAREVGDAMEAVARGLGLCWHTRHTERVPTRCDGSRRAHMLLSIQMSS